MRKSLIKIFISVAFLIVPLVSDATTEVETPIIPECSENLTPEMKMGDPACWVSLPVSSWQDCHWEPIATECSKDLIVESILEANDVYKYWIGFGDYYALDTYDIDKSLGTCKSKMIYDYYVASDTASEEQKESTKVWQDEISEYSGIDNLDEFKESWNDPCPDGAANSTCIDTMFQSTCGPITCSNATPLGKPVDYKELVDTVDYLCYYTTVSAWGLPDGDGMVLASAVTQHSTQVEAECVNEPNFKYVNAVTDLKIKNINDSAYTDSGIVDVKKSEAIDLSWSAENATTCSVPGTNTGVNWSGSKDLAGSQLNTNVASAPKPLSASDSPTIMDYQLTCQNGGGVPNTDTVNVRVKCDQDLDPAWGECDKACGAGAKEHRIVTYENCFTQEEERDCVVPPGDCAASSDWREVRP